jgi:hypothetical protein
MARLVTPELLFTGTKKLRKAGTLSLYTILLFPMRKEEEFRRMNGRRSVCIGRPLAWDTPGLAAI